MQVSVLAGMPEAGVAVLAYMAVAYVAVVSGEACMAVVRMLDSSSLAVVRSLAVAVEFGCYRSSQILYLVFVCIRMILCRWGLGFGVWGLGFGVWEIGRAHV